MGLGDAWRVSASILFVSNGAAVMGGLARESNMLNATLARQQGQITKNEMAMIRYRERMEAVRASQVRFGTALALSIGVVGVTAIAAATNEAAKFQRAMTGVQLTTHAAGQTFSQLQKIAFNTSNITAQSAVTIAQEMQETSKVLFPGQPDKLRAVFPLIARYADVRQMATQGKEDPVETVRSISAFAHMFTAYTPAAINKMLNDTAKLQQVTEAPLNQLVTQGGYFIRRAVGAGVSESDIMDNLALMGQTGFLRGKGGSALQNVISNSLGAESITNHMSKARRSGFQDLGVWDSQGRFKFVDEKGHFLLDKMEKHLANMNAAFIRADPRRGAGRFSTDLENAYGKTGARFMAIAGDDNAQAQMDNLRRQRARTADVQGQFDAYQNDFFVQWQVFTTNLRNLGTAAMLPNLPTLTNGLKAINGLLSSVGSWLMDHPDAGKKIFEGFAWVTGVALVRAALGAGAMVGKLSLALDALAVSSGRVAVAEGAVATGEAAILGGGLAGLGARIGGFMGLLDRVFLAGLGGVVARFGTSLITGLNVRVLLPLLGLAGRLPLLGPWFGRLAISMTAAFSQAATLEGGISALGLALGRLAGPIGTILGVVLTPSAANTTETTPLFGRSRAFWQAYYQQHGAAGMPTDVVSQMGLMRGPPTVPMQNHGRNPVRDLQQTFNITVKADKVDVEGGRKFAESFRAGMVNKTGLRGSGSAVVSPLLGPLGTGAGSHGF